MIATKKYDMIVIGAGSGGMGGGRRAAEHGQKVAMIENRVIGGTCVNVGCVPKKVMFNMANFIEEAQIMKDYGVQGVENLTVDFAKFKTKRDAYVKRLNKIYETNIANSKIDYFKGTASFVSPNEIQTSEGESLQADHILIASGSTPAQVALEGGEHCISSDGIFEMEQLPESIVVLGAGYIAVEMAQIMTALGVRTTLLARNKMLTLVDQEVVASLETSMKVLGLDVRLGTPFTSVQDIGGGMKRVNLQNGDHVDAQVVLCALGRPPNVDDLKLENAGVIVEKGAIKVDEYQNTNVPGVYAIGDVTNQVCLTPVAIRQGRIVSERLFNNKPTLKMNYDNIPTVIFSHPPIGVIGHTEEQAVQQYGQENIKVYKSNFINMFYSPCDHQEHKLKSLIKLICRVDGETERVIGCHAIGRNIDEMMQGVSVAITMGASKQDFDNSVAIHPTGSEEFVLMSPVVKF